MNASRRYRNPMPARLNTSPVVEEVTLTGRRSWPTGTVPVALAPAGVTETVALTAEQEAFRAALTALLDGEDDPTTLATELTTVWARLSGPGKRRVAELFSEAANHVDADPSGDT